MFIISRKNSRKHINIKNFFLILYFKGKFSLMIVCWKININDCINDLTIDVEDSPRAFVQRKTREKITGST